MIEINKKNDSSLITYLQWDSSFFNLQIGKIEGDLFSANQLDYIWDCQESSGYDLIYLFANTVYEPARQWLADKGITPADVKITYKKNIHKPVPADKEYIEKYNGIVSTKLLQLTYESGHKSRFKNDPYLNHRFRDMYKKWIEKSVNGEMADAVLLAKLNGIQGGFVTIKKDGEQGTIGLIAVDQEMRGKGIGRSLLNAAENWCINENCTKLLVATQKENQQACRLYERNSFSEFSIQHIYHLHREQLRDVKNEK